MDPQQERQYANMMATVYNWLTEYQAKHGWFTFGALVNGQNSGFIFQGRGRNDQTPQGFYVEILRRGVKRCCVTLNFRSIKNYKRIDEVRIAIGWKEDDGSVNEQYNELATAIAPTLNTNQDSTSFAIVKNPPNDAYDAAVKKGLFTWLDDHEKQLSATDLDPYRFQPKNPLDRIKDLMDHGFLARSENNEVYVPDTALFGSAGEKTDGNDAEVKTIESDSELVKTIKQLLKANLNVILTGAPGTGKTYTAKEVAKTMVGAKVSENATDDEKKRAKSVEEERIKSVQFHPGYDYSDFVVGMKPVLIFEGKKVFRDTQGFYIKRDEKKEKYDEKNIEKRLSVGSKTEVSFLWEDGIFKKFADKAKKAYEEWVSIDGHKPEDAPKFVFLIDEINRSDLSRVFGELFSLLEEEYRYPNDKGTGITLPNGENFVIPRNLYILGTMNDIDRSVESMDFALRRRFAWFEVKPEDPDSENMDAIIQAKVDDDKISREYAEKLDKAMKALNKLIAPPQKKGEGGDAQKTGDKPKVDLRLGSEYQLGGAIFAKFEKYAGGKDPFGELWRNHIENILKEYLRGRSNRDDLLKELKDVYETSVGISTGTKEPAQ